MSIFHAIYVSTATCPLSSEQLRDLLNASRQRNKRLGLTGLLLYARNRFIQVLEGPEEAVKEVIGSIRRDYRHKNMDILRYEKKEARNFPDWRMGFRNFIDEMEDLSAVSRFLDPDFDTTVFKNDSSEAYHLLLAFRNANA